MTELETAPKPATMVFPYYRSDGRMDTVTLPRNEVPSEVLDLGSYYTMDRAERKRAYNVFERWFSGLGLDQWRAPWPRST